ncbi:DUF2059 domain-containing protein [Salinarimonas soli]|uniref:DUF2059 domain-containing protein n=1 Tax=Salinarimonas soli TaxID=1638099 RepID=A0A5B2VW44_9HYPH|nr:DUF2059 domain-containing protein [Salinarimonas soli]KAA2242269.1 DUF2059 domain-containing protein [Salinarimonas soli]
MTFSIRHGLVALTLILATAAVPAQAQTGGSREEALSQEIMAFQVKQIDIDALTQASLDQIVQNLRIADPKVRADLLSLAPVLKEEFQPILDSIVKAMAGFFRDNFTVEELMQLRAFYASPVGMKMTVKGSEFGTRMGGALHLAMQERGPAIVERIKVEMEKRGHRL